MYRLVDSEGFFRYIKQDGNCYIPTILGKNEFQDKTIFYDKETVVVKF